MPAAERFLKVPLWLFRVPDLSAADVLTMAALLDHDRQHPGVEPRLRELAAVLAKDPRNVQRSIDRLEAAGLVTRRSQNGRPTGYDFKQPKTHGDVAVGERTETDGKVAVGQLAKTHGEVAVTTHGDVAAEPTAKLPKTHGEVAVTLLREEREERSKKSDRSRLSKALRDPRVQEVVSHYRERLKPSERWKPEGKHNGRHRAIVVLDRLEGGLSVELLKRAVDGMAGTDWYRQNGQTDLELCMRADKVDGFITRAVNGGTKTHGSHPPSTQFDGPDDSERLGLP